MKAFYFYLESCGPCKFFYPKAEASLKERGVEVEKINLALEENKHYKDKYELRSVPTIIISNGETELFRHVGTSTFDVII